MSGGERGRNRTYNLLIKSRCTGVVRGDLASTFRCLQLVAHAGSRQFTLQRGRVAGRATSVVRGFNFPWGGEGMFGELPGELVGLITQRSKVQILPPQPFHSTVVSLVSSFRKSAQI